MRRPTRLAVPRTGAAVCQLFFLLLPGPGFDHTVHPQVHVEASLVAVHVAHLLLPSPFYLLDILEHLLLAAPIRHPLQYFHYRRGRVGREVRQPVLLLLDQHHADYTPGRTPRRQERFDCLDHLLAILHAFHLLPTALLPGPLGQTDPLFAVGRWPARSTLLGRHRLGHAPQSG